MTNAAERRRKGRGYNGFRADGQGATPPAPASLVEQNRAWR